jgi:hypothetical protein
MENKRRIKFGPSSEKIRKENKEWTWAQFAKERKNKPGPTVKEEEQN